MKTDKKTALELGKKTRERLVRVAKRAANATTEDELPHTYIYSPAGLGKTFTINQQIALSGREFYEVSGNTSMFAFGVRLAVLNYLVPKDQTIIVSVDDCDELLKNEQNCNIMKNVLEGAKAFNYEKSLQSQWSSLTEVQQKALEFHMNDQVIGFRVPTHRMIFIFASNTELPHDDEVQEAKDRQMSKSVLMSHRNAMRSRCLTVDFDLDQDTHWGWIADVVYNTNVVKLNEEQKDILLDFLYDNWDDMKERSIRTTIKMAQIMLSEPDDFEDTWYILMLK